MKEPGRRMTSLLSRQASRLIQIRRTEACREDFGFKSPRLLPSSQIG